MTARAYLHAVRQKAVPVDTFVTAALRSLAKDKAIVVVPRSAASLWYLSRISPDHVQRLTGSLARTVQRDLIRPRSPSTGSAQ